MINEIIIIGSGLSGHFTALYLQQKFTKANFTIINDEKTPTIGVGESGILDLPNFLFNIAKIDINDFYQDVHPIHKMGINFRDWVKIGFNYNYSFDGDCRNFNLIDSEEEIVFGSYLIKNNISPVSNSSSIYSPYSYQIDNLKFVSFLKKIAIKRGMKYINKKVIDIELEKNKKIKNLVLEDNEKIKADFYIDCSGFSGLIAKKTKTKFDSFRNQLPCDYAVVGQHEIEKDEIKSYTVSTRKKCGWQWEIDTSERAGKGYVFCSEFSSIDESINLFLKDNPKIKEHRVIPFPSGKYENICGENYFLNGNAQGFAEPLESTGFSITFLSVDFFINLINHKSTLTETNQKLFNDYVNNFWSYIVDFLVLHYKKNEKIDNNLFWEYCDKEIKQSDRLKNILNYLSSNDFESNFNYILNSYWPNDPIFGLDGVFTHVNARKILKNKIDFYKKDQLLNNFKRAKTFFITEKDMIDFGYNKIDFFNIIKNKKNYVDFI